MEGQGELWEKLGLPLALATREALEVTPTGNFLEHLLALVQDWDLVVDKAYRMTAGLQGEENQRTRRYRLGQRLPAHTRHLLTVPQQRGRVLAQLFSPLPWLQGLQEVLEEVRVRLGDGGAGQA